MQPMLDAHHVKLLNVVIFYLFPKQGLSSLQGCAARLKQHVRFRSARSEGFERGAECGCREWKCISPSRCPPRVRNATERSSPRNIFVRRKYLSGKSHLLLRTYKWAVKVSNVRNPCVFHDLFLYDLYAAHLNWAIFCTESSSLEMWFAFHRR